MHYQRARYFLGGLNLATILLMGLPVHGGQLVSGETFFNVPPLLVESATTYNAVSVPAARYYFTISLPAGATEPLAQIIFQRQASPDPIQFEPENTTAFIGTQQNQGTALVVKSTWEESTGKLDVRFDPPISPGTTFSVRLAPEQNPDVPGVYQFRVFALPAGLKSKAMDLGVARFHFYRDIF